MKSLVHLTFAATLAVGAVAHSHQHLHRHGKKHSGSTVAKRGSDPVVEYVAGPAETVYQLDGKLLSAEEAKAGLVDGQYIVIGETTPTKVPPPPPKPTSKDLGAQFVEKLKISSSPPPPPATSSAPPQPKPVPSGNTSGGQGLNTPFPSGQLPCSRFPSNYGAVPISWLGTSGWTSIQQLGSGFSLKLSTSVNNIVAGVSGDDCSPHSTCSYACPPGYQKSQWTPQQGATGQSVGGLYCNADGMLELSNPQYNTLCIPGEGGITVENDMDEVASICRTDYPGSEAMVIPAVAQPGGSVALCNPDQAAYYQWQSKKTSAQYYVNPKGVTAEEGCVWKNPNCSDCGNWAPIIIGVGQDNGITYLSVFQNAPTTNAKLDFNIEITGDVNSKCGYNNGQFIGGATGCTVSGTKASYTHETRKINCFVQTGVPKGGKAVFRFYD